MDAGHILLSRMNKLQTNGSAATLAAILPALASLINLPSKKYKFQTLKIFSQPGGPDTLGWLELRHFFPPTRFQEVRKNNGGRLRCREP